MAVFAGRAGPHHRARRPRIGGAQDLADQTVVAFPHGCSYRRLLVDWFAAAGVTPRRFLDLGSYHAIVACVAAGTGVAIMPARRPDNAVMGDSIQRHELPEAMRTNRTSLVWAGEPGGPLSAAGSAGRRPGWCLRAPWSNKQVDALRPARHPRRRAGRSACKLMALVGDAETGNTLTRKQVPR